MLPLLILFDVVTLGALAFFVVQRDIVRSRQFLFSAAGCVVMTAGQLMVASLGLIALATLCFGLLLVLTGAYFSDDRRSPKWLDDTIRFLFRSTTPRR